MGKRRSNIDPDVLAERYREVMADVRPHTPVHIEGGPCVETAPDWHRFTDEVHLVTCDVCQVAVAMLDDTQQDDRDGRRDFVGTRSRKVADALEGEPDPYALALYKAKHEDD